MPVGNTLWRKIRRDLMFNKGKAMLVIAAITIGVAAAGSILSAYSIITREIDRNYGSTNPSSATLLFDSVSQNQVDLALSDPDVAYAEPRREVIVRLVGTGDDWTRMSLVVVGDFNDLRVATFFPESGGWDPAPDEILIERASLSEVDVGVGDDISVSVASGEEQSFTVIGLVHDPGRTPAWMTGVAVGYVTPDGLSRLGLGTELDELLIVTTENVDRESNRVIADRVAVSLGQGSSVVRIVEVPVPGEHPSESVMQTMLFLLQAFGVVALVSSGALVATLIAAQLKQQRREIGVMKAVGARTQQIAGIYLGTVMLLGAVGLAIGIPLGLLGGRGFIAFTFGLLNFDVESFRLDPWVLPALILAGLAIPLLAAWYPVRRSIRVPVREVMDDRGISTNSERSGGLGARLSWPTWLGRTVVFGIRNVFRTRSRTVLTVFAVGLGGAAFMVALNTGVAWNNAVDSEFEGRVYGLEVQLDKAYNNEEIERALSVVPEIGAIEMWDQYAATIELASGRSGDVFRLLVPTLPTEMIDYPLMEGRWLRPDDVDKLVVNQILDDPRPVVGGVVSVVVDGETTTYEVVGIVRQLTGGSTGIAYAGTQPADRGRDGHANHIRITGTESVSAAADVADQLSASGIGVVAVVTADDGRESLEDHLLIIVGLLLIMAVLISIVGGLGLVESMSISVLERRRELGIMRAVGASTGSILKVVVVEGVLIAAMSWVVALLLSIPATVLVENITGQIFLQAPLVTKFSALGIVLWLVIVISLATVASALPALEATEMPVHQALAYE